MSETGGPFQRRDRFAGSCGSTIPRLSENDAGNIQFKISSQKALSLLLFSARGARMLGLLKNLVGGLDRAYKTVWAFLLSKHVLQWVFEHAKPTTQGVQYNEECRFSYTTKVKRTLNYHLST